MKYPLLGKVAAIGAVTAAMLIGLNAIDGIVEARLGSQAEAQQSMADSLAGPQALLGPALVRRCRETWTPSDSESRDRKVGPQQREFTQTLWPAKLDVKASSTIEERHRGLFKVNGFVAQTAFSADWADTTIAGTAPVHLDGQISCDPAAVALSISDARGIRSARVLAADKSLDVRPGSLWTATPRGVHAALPDTLVHGAPLHVEIELELAGTSSLAFTPVGAVTSAALTSNWPHPSFAGQFLPVSSDVTDEGFMAGWQVSGLATSALQTLRDGGRLCTLLDSSPSAIGAAQRDGAPADEAKRACAETFGVHFIDPVNRYLMSERVLKYGFLFIALTFVCVLLIEIKQRLRVHPVQYLLVGCAATIFFLLLVGLSEYLSFVKAYAIAAAAPTALLTFYASFLFGGRRAGVAFGVSMATLYFVLYELLLLEQGSLLLGSILAFLALGAVIVATRSMNWYALADDMKQHPPSAGRTRPASGPRLKWPAGAP